MRRIKGLLLQQKWLRKTIDFLVWLTTKVLPEEAQKKIKAKLSNRQKELLKNIIIGENFNARAYVSEVKYKLLNLGFVEQGYDELNAMAENNGRRNVQKEAIWELAWWHADQNNVDDVRIALPYLLKALEDEKSKEKMRQGVLLEIELLNALDEPESARIKLNQRLSVEFHPDLLLAAANLERVINDKMYWINKLMRYYGLSEIGLEKTSNSNWYDGLKTVVKTNSAARREENPKVSVLMPVFNAERVIETAIKSVLGQTWRNLELIIVDDCSTDNTVEIVEQYLEFDERVKLIRAKQNGGTYIARNLGLQAATGEYITCHDADDWSHAERIEKQVTHLILNNKILANTSEQCRITEQLKFHRRKQQREYISVNMSSLLFKRKEVIDRVGYWDSVRFGADGEFVRRIRKVFGENSIVNLKTGPLSFPRISSSSLTESSAFGYNGFFFGARKEYVESFSMFHESGESLRYDFPQIKRPFPVPEPMKPSRMALKERHFNVIIASDFRLMGGTTSSNVEEIKAQREAGLSTALIQMSRYQGSGERRINTKIRDLIDGDKVQMLVYGEKVTCDVLIVRHPPVLQEFQQYIPEVKASRICVIVNQTPKVDYGENERIAYNISRCQEHLVKYFGQKGTWYPIGPLIRETLYKYHEEELQYIQLAEDDWVNIINVQEWTRSKPPEGSKKIRIGRHSRDQYVKWPSDRNQLLSIYPNSEEYEIRILGGAKIPQAILGGLPRNWRVLEFGEIEPKEFLSELDVFVYYIHPECVEAFGRVIIEAMACGVPVILPRSYQRLFQDAAIYAGPEEVQGKIMRLMNSTNEYNYQSQKAREYVNERFGYSSHIQRLKYPEVRL